MSTLIILDWYPYISLFHDLLCKFGLSVSGLRKIRFNAYTPSQISTKKTIRKETRLPIVILDRRNVDLLLFKKESGKIESWSIEFAWQFQSVPPSPVEIGRN